MASPPSPDKLIYGTANGAVPYSLGLFAENFFEKPLDNALFGCYNQSIIFKNCDEDGSARSYPRESAVL